MKKAFVNLKACIGCGTCTAVCAPVFELDSKGKAIVKTEWASGEKDLPECTQEAIDSCPVTAIKSAD